MSESTSDQRWVNTPVPVLWAVGGTRGRGAFEFMQMNRLGDVSIDWFASLVNARFPLVLTEDNHLDCKVCRMPIPHRSMFIDEEPWCPSCIVLMARDRVWPRKRLETMP